MTFELMIILSNITQERSSESNSLIINEKSDGFIVIRAIHDACFT